MSGTPTERTMGLEAFVFDLLTLYRRHDCMDIDGGDMHELLVKHHLMVERRATEDDLENEWLREYGVEPGDIILVDADELTALRSQLEQ